MLFSNLLVVLAAILTSFPKEKQSKMKSQIVTTEPLGLQNENAHSAQSSGGSAIIATGLS